MQIKNIRFFKSEIIILILVIFIGCGKSSGDSSDSTGGNGTNPPTGTVTTISFNPAGTPVNNSVYLESIGSNNDEITLAVKVKGGSDVFGGALEITYDGNKIKYLSAVRGSYLGSETDTNFSSVLYKSQEGVLLIGVDKKGTVSGANGEGILVTIVFKALTTQTNTSIGFNATNSRLKSSNGDIPGTSWFGGNLSYQ